MAPGWPGIPPRWTSSAKSGAGTALNLHSRVWFTLSHGIVNEIYYPHVDQPNTRDFQFLISDGETFCHEEKRDLEHEVFCCLYLDKRHRLIQFQELFRGTIDGASVHPREIVKLALQRNSAAVIIAHNHPSGVAEPSQADEMITQRVKEALALVDIRLLDHIIIGDGTSVSLAERGVL